MQTIYKVMIALKAADLEQLTEAVVDFDEGDNPQEGRCRVIKFASLNDLLNDRARCSACKNVRGRWMVCSSKAVSCQWQDY